MTGGRVIILTTSCHRNGGTATALLISAARRLKALKMMLTVKYTSGSLPFVVFPNVSDREPRRVGFCRDNEDPSKECMFVSVP
jgi:hypothetical protein